MVYTNVRIDINMQIVPDIYVNNESECKNERKNLMD